MSTLCTLEADLDLQKGDLVNCQDGDYEVGPFEIWSIDGNRVQIRLGDELGVPLPSRVLSPVLQSLTTV